MLQPQEGRNPTTVMMVMDDGQVAEETATITYHSSTRSTLNGLLAIRRSLVHIGLLITYYLWWLCALLVPGQCCLDGKRVFAVSCQFETERGVVICIEAATKVKVRKNR